MLKDPKKCIAEKTVKNLIDSKTQLQQVGIDVTVREVYRFKDSMLYNFASIGAIDFDNKNRTLPEVENIPFTKGIPLQLDPQAYIVTTNEVFTLNPFEFGMIFPRSSLSRCGASLQSAIFDPGYFGAATVLLLVVHNPNGLRLYQDARIGQFLCFRTGFKANKYKGVYQGKTEVVNEVK
jgi:dUTP pyrophosphatase